MSGVLVLTGPGGFMHRNLVSSPALGVAAAGLALAACSSSPGSTTGSEVLSGSTTSIASDAVPITAHGVSDDHGSLALGSSNSSKGTVKLAGGNVDVTHSAGTTGSPRVDKATCSASSVTSGTYKVTGGTGKYKGARGTGHYAITFDESAMKSGKCDLSALSNPNAVPSGGKLSFHATGQWTVKS